MELTLEFIFMRLVVTVLIVLFIMLQGFSILDFVMNEKSKQSSTHHSWLDKSFNILTLAS
jgi:hypothetical protein